MIGVRNNGIEEVKGRYDGKDYIFKPGVTLALSEEAATHILGYGLDDKTRALIRLGWLQNAEAYTDAVKRLDQFQFLSEAKVEFQEPTKIAKKVAEEVSDTSGLGLKIPEFTKQK